MTAPEPGTGPGSGPREAYRNRVRLVLIVWAGLVGAGGVALGAVAAHRVDSPALVTASNMAMISAAAVVAVLALAASLGRSRLWTGAGALMLAAASLFSGDIALHTLTGNHLFPFAAPIGGSGLILSWLAVAGLGLAALVAPGR